VTKLTEVQAALPEYQWEQGLNGPLAHHGQTVLSIIAAHDAPHAVRIYWPKQRAGSTAATADIHISGAGATLREAHDSAWVNFAKGCANVNAIFGGSDAETPTAAKMAVRHG
jgi:hypothetical protein